MENLLHRSSPQVDDQCQICPCLMSASQSLFLWQDGCWWSCSFSRRWKANFSITSVSCVASVLGSDTTLLVLLHACNKLISLNNHFLWVWVLYTYNYRCIRQTKHSTQPSTVISITNKKQFKKIKNQYFLELFKSWFKSMINFKSADLNQIILILCFVKQLLDSRV